MRVVVDASVILKWLFQDPVREADTRIASALLESVIRAEIDILQPVHWLAEVAAVLARLSPETAVTDVQMLSSLEFATSNSASTIGRATALASQMQQHLFDTLYHAVALEEEATLITADDRYRRKAEAYGQIIDLRSWTAVS